MEVNCISMIHAAALHFLWPFAVRYAAHQLNLWPRVSLPETSPTLSRTGKVGDASVFRVWGSRAFVRDTCTDKLSSCAIPCVLLGFSRDEHGWQFYHPTSHRVFLSQVVTFDESVPFYRLFPYRSAFPPPPPLFLVLGPPPVEPLLLQGPAPSGVSQVNPLRGTAPVEPGGARSEGAGSGDAEPGGAEPEIAKPAGVESGGAERKGVETGVLGLGMLNRRVRSLGVVSLGTLSPQQLCEWLVRRARLWSGATGAGGTGGAGAGGAAVFAGAGGTEGTTAAGPGGARTKGIGAAGTGGVEGAGARDPMEQGAAGARGAVGAGAGGAGAIDPGAGGAGGIVRPRPYFVPLLQQDLGVPSSTSLTPPLRCPPPDQSPPPIQPASPLPAPSPYTEQSGGLTERREPASRPASPVCTDRRVPRLRPLPVPGTHAMALRLSSIPLHAAMDAEMASWKSIGTYVDEAPPPGLNIVDGVWIFRVKRPPGSPPAFKARHVARGFSQRQGVDYFQTFSPTPKMTTLWVLLHVAAQRDYELHSLDFSTAFLQGSLHEEIWMRRPPGFTGSFPAGTQWSLRRPVYGLRQAPQEWHHTPRTTLAALGFIPSTADLSLFLRTDTSLPPFYVLVYVDNLVFATTDIEALILVKSELQKRHTCTDLGELRSYLGLQITQDKARCTITLTQSHMVHQILQRFGFQFSSP
ncbi:unnamed protein product [Closterium sp. NIES-54]